MSHSAVDQANAELALETVIDSLLESQKALRTAGQQITNPEIREAFLGESLLRAQFRGELESVLHREGVKDIPESGTALGKATRAWGAVKALFVAQDDALLSTLEGVEEATCQAYRNTAGTDLPLPTRQLLTTQAAHVESVRECLTAMRSDAA